MKKVALYTLIAQTYLFFERVSVAIAQSTNGTGFQGTNGGAGQGTNGTGFGSSNSVSLNNPLKADSITGLFNDLIDIVLVFAVPIIVFFIIYAGFLYVTARGNTEQVSKASRALLYAVIGGVLILGAKALLVVIQGTVAAIGS